MDTNTTNPQTPKADINIRPSFEWGFRYTVKVYDSQNKLCNVAKGWRPNGDWAGSTARRKAKHMVKAQERREKKGSEDHIRNYKVEAGR